MFPFKILLCAVLLAWPALLANTRRAKYTIGSLQARAKAAAGQGGQALKESMPDKEIKDQIKQHGIYVVKEQSSKAFSTFLNSTMNQEVTGYITYMIGAIPAQLFFDFQIKEVKNKQVVFRVMPGLFEYLVRFIVRYLAERPSPQLFLEVSWNANKIKRVSLSNGAGWLFPVHSVVFSPTRSS